MFIINIQLQTKPADVMADFLKDKSRFADFVNLFLFDGRQVILPSHLYTYDSDSSTVFYQEEKIASIGRRRDCIMLARIDDLDVLIAIEHQQTIDYSMPFRVLMYDAINYNQQYNQLEKTEKRFFHPIPVVTFVLYTGQRWWRQPRMLIDMMHIPESIRDKINNWNLNVYDIKDTQMLEKLHCQDNQNVVNAISQFYHWNGDISHLGSLTMSKEAAVVVATIIGEEEILKTIKQEESEEIDMCTSVTMALNKAREDGAKEGKKELLMHLLQSKLGVLSDNDIKKIEEGEEVDMCTSVTMALNKARQQGREDGAKEEKKELLMNLLQVKLGVLSDEVINKIERSDNKQLDTLTHCLFSIKNEEDILHIIA